MAYRLDTATDFIDFGDKLDGIAAFTMHIVFKVHTNSASGTNRLVCKNASGSGTRGWGVRVHDGSAQRVMLVWNDATAGVVSPSSDATGNLTTGTVYSLAIVHDPTQVGGAGAEKVRIYLNAVSVAHSDGVGGIGKTVTDLAVNTAVNFRVGKDAETGNNAAPIDIQLLEVVSSALNQTQVTDLYNAGVFKKMADAGITPAFSKNFLTGGDLTTIVPDVDTLSVGNLTGSGLADPGVDFTLYVPPPDEGPDVLQFFFRRRYGRGSKLRGIVGRTSVPANELIFN